MQTIEVNHACADANTRSFAGGEFRHADIDTLRRTVLPASFKRAFARTIALADELGERHAVATLEKLAADYAAPALRVLVFGEFNRGKSTLINALLGRVVLPASLVPTTGHVTTVARGQKEQVNLMREGILVESHPLSQVNAIPSLRAIDTRRDDIGEIMVTVNDARLRDIVLMDTPGMNDDAARHTRTEAAIGRADLVLFVLDARLLLGEYERILAVDWLQKDWGKPILPIVNFMHLVPEEERAEVRQRMATWCTDHVTSWFSPAWLEVDALLALRHALGHGPAPVDDFAHLRKLLFETDAVDSSLRMHLQRHSRTVAMRTALRSLGDANTARLMTVQASAADTALRSQAVYGALAARLASLESASMSAQSAVAMRAQEHFDDALIQLMYEFEGRSKDDLDDSATELYQASFRRCLQEIEREAREQVRSIREDGLGLLTIAEDARVVPSTSLYVASLPDAGASAADVVKAAAMGAVVGSFIPVVGTFWGAAIGGGLAALAGGGKANPVPVYQACALRAWEADVETAVQAICDAIAEYAACAGRIIEQRAAADAGALAPHLAHELQQREALVQSIAACETNL